MEKFEFDRNFQINLLALMYQKWDFLVLVADLLRAEYFEDKILVWYFQRIIEYYKDYSKKPDEIVIHNELIKAAKSKIFSENELPDVAEVFESLKKTVLSEAYVQDEVLRFCRRQAVRSEILRSVSLTNSNDSEVWDQISSNMFKACTVGTDALDLGIWLGDVDERVRKRLSVDERKIIPTRVGELDGYIGGGPKAGQLMLWVAATGGGKCLKKGTKVITFDGRIVPVEGVQEGEFLMGPDSSPRKVLSTVKGKEEMFEITPVKGTPWACTLDHVLTLIDTRKSRGNKVIDIPLKDYLSKHKTFKNMHKLFHSTAIEFPKLLVPLPMDPYMLGAWFGDGSKALGNAEGRARIPTVGLTSADPELVAMWKETAMSFGLEMTEHDKRDNASSTFHIVGRVWGGEGHRTYGGSGGWANPVLDLLRKTVGPKAEVPHEYLVSSKEERAQFLAGFLDTDGYYSHKSFEITQKRKDWADAICFIARSLGLHVSIKKVFKAATNTIKKEKKPYWRMVISGDSTFLPMRLPRKIPHPRKQIKNVLRTGIKSVESVGVEEYYGFTLDGDHRFLLEDFTVTHNSVGLVHCGKVAVCSGYKVVHYTLELSADEVFDRYDSNWTKIPIRDISSRGSEVLSKMGQVREKYGNNLLVKEFPTKSVTVLGIKSHIQRLRNIGFIPDLIIVDYLDLLKPSTSYNDEYSDLGSITGELRGLAMEFKVPVQSATQVNRTGVASHTLDITHISDSMQKAFIADIMVGICMTKEERDLKIARVVGLKNRNGPVSFEVPIHTDYARMCFYDVMASKAAPEIKPEEILEGVK